MILDDIVAKKKVTLKKRKQIISREKLKKQTESFNRTPLDFAGAISQDGLSIIAEVKKASPSKGVICEDFDPDSIAKRYLNSGVQAMSILTEEDFFQGSDHYLESIRTFADIPLLRKDFIIDEYQIYEAYLMGADAILLIASILDDSSMKAFHGLATSLGLHCLNEVHDKEELDRVLALDFPIVGINNRNLRTFDERLETTVELREYIPCGKIIVSESGIRTENDIQKIAAANVDAVLIGEAFMRNPDTAEAVRRLKGAL